MNRSSSTSGDARFWVAGALNWLVVAGLAFVGIDYVTATEPEPHHLHMLELSFEELAPGTSQLLMTLIKGTGLVAIVTAYSLAVLLAVPFRRRENWSRWAILSVGGLTLIPSLIKAVENLLRFSAPVPWWPHAVMLTMLFTAFWLTRDFSGRARERVG